MDGKNAYGRRVSLLNDSADEAPAKARATAQTAIGNGYRRELVDAPQQRYNYCPTAYSARGPHSRTSSYSSSSRSPASLSPQTPPLESGDSSDSTAMQTPSPVTPDFSFEQLPAASALGIGVGQTAAASPGLYGHPATGKESLPPFPAGLAQGLAYAPAAAAPAQAHPVHPAVAPATSSRSTSYGDPQQQQQQSRQQHPTTAGPSAAAAAAAAAGAAQQGNKKNSYPCPLAKQFGCSDFFTTSGHAARHAKKHTGKKDAFCPECGKAFTRKDNMEQHRRTHQSGRKAAKAAPVAADDPAVAKKAAAGTTTSTTAATKPQPHHHHHQQLPKRPKPAPLQGDGLPPSRVASMDIDSSAPTSPASSFYVPPPQHQYATGSAYGDPSAAYNSSSANGGPWFEMPNSSSQIRLETLAIAASGEKRKYHN